MTSQNTSSDADWLRIAEAFAAKESSSADDVIKLVAGLRGTVPATAGAAPAAVAPAPAPTASTEPAPAPAPAPAADTTKRAEQIHSEATETTPSPEKKKTGRPRKSTTSASAAAPVETQAPAPAETEEPTAAGGDDFAHITKAKDEGKEPAVPIDQAVNDEYVVCLECGRSMKMLKRHLGSTHGMSPEEYKYRWDLPDDFPITAPNYSASKSEYAKDMGFGITGSKAAPKKRGRKKAAAK